MKNINIRISNLEQFNSFKISKEKQSKINAGIGGGYFCKNGTSSGSSDTATESEIAEVAKANCKGKGGVKYTYYFEDAYLTQE